jgi:hypothetical protein
MKSRVASEGPRSVSSLRDPVRDLIRYCKNHPNSDVGQLGSAIERCPTCIERCPGVTDCAQWRKLDLRSTA